MKKAKKKKIFLQNFLDRPLFQGSVGKPETRIIFFSALYACKDVGHFPLNKFTKIKTLLKNIPDGRYAKMAEVAEDFKDTETAEQMAEHAKMGPKIPKRPHILKIPKWPKFPKIPKWPKIPKRPT